MMWAQLSSPLLELLPWTLIFTLFRYTFLRYPLSKLYVFFNLHQFKIKHEFLFLIYTSAPLRSLHIGDWIICEIDNISFLVNGFWQKVKWCNATPEFFTKLKLNWRIRSDQNSFCTAPLQVTVEAPEYLFHFWNLFKNNKQHFSGPFLWNEN